MVSAAATAATKRPSAPPRPPRQYLRNAVSFGAQLVLRPSCIPIHLRTSCLLQYLELLGIISSVPSYNNTVEKFTKNSGCPYSPGRATIPVKMLGFLRLLFDAHDARH